MDIFEVSCVWFFIRHLSAILQQQAVSFSTFSSSLYENGEVCFDDEFLGFW